MRTRDSFTSLSTESAQRSELQKGKNPSLVEQSDVRRRVRFLVHCLVEERSLEDEICQEALIHFWKCELLSPGHPVNYYLRSCLFRIQNILKAGRSVHCPRHRSVLSFADEDFEDANGDRIQSLASAEETLQQVCVRDAFGQLFRLLEPLEKRILVLLSQGHQVCEIARHLKISHSTVTKRRNRIAETAVSIGFSPDVGFEPPIRVTKL